MPLDGFEPNFFLKIQNCQKYHMRSAILAHSALKGFKNL
jgi:hypothetical protein